MPNAVPSRLLASAACALALLAGIAPAHAGDSATAMLRITVTVPEYFRLQQLSQPAGVEVSEADIARGYVDVAAPVRMTVETNSRDGYTIQFAQFGEHFRQAQVQGLGQEMQLAPQGSMHWRPNAQRETLEFRFRFRLDRALAPGHYPWPVQVSMGGA